MHTYRHHPDPSVETPAFRDTDRYVAFRNPIHRSGLAGTTVPRCRAVSPIRVIVLLILGLALVRTAAAQRNAFPRLEYWHTAGAGLSTPLGFNAGTSFSIRLAGPLFLQASVSATKDVYITKHSALALSPALGLRSYSAIAMTSIAVGPSYVMGSRGLDLGEAGAAYTAPALNVVGQLLFREINMGVEFYTNFNPVRNVSGMRLIYRLGRLR